MKLLLDEQISGKVAERLRDADHDVIATAAEASLRGLDDADLFAFAQHEGLALVTYDSADFEAVVRGYISTRREHHGLVLVHPARFPSWESARLVKSLSGFLAGPELGQSFLVWLQDAGSP